LKIEDHTSGKNDHKEINSEGASIPVLALKKLMKDGYVHLKPFKENKTIDLQGKALLHVLRKSNCGR